MNILLKMAGAAGLMAAAVTATSFSALSGEAAPAEKQAIVTNLDGKATAVTYWAKGTEGLEVITTIDAAPAGDAPGAKPAIIRVSAVLQPGQHQLISVPGEVGRRGAALRISRVADSVAVEKVADLSY